MYCKRMIICLIFLCVESCRTSLPDPDQIVPKEAPSKNISANSENFNKNKEAYRRLISLQIKSIQNKTRKFLSENNPNSKEERQIFSIFKTASEQNSEIISQYFLSSESKDLDKAQKEIASDVSNLKIDDQNGLLIKQTSTESQSQIKNEKEAHIQSAGIFMVVLGSLGILTPLATGSLVWASLADPDSRNGKVNSGVLNAWKRGYFDTSSSSKDASKDARLKGIILGRAEKMAIVGSLIALGLSVAMVAIGAQIIKNDNPSETLKHAGGAVLITTGAASILLGAKISRNAWLANATPGKKLGRAGLFGLIPITIGLSAAGVGAAALMLAEQKPPLQVFLTDIGENVRKIQLVRKEALR